MAEFNPQTRDTGVIDETSRSRGTGPNRTFETLFSGLTETASNVINIQDTQNQLDIQDDARQMFDSVNEEFGVSAPTPEGVTEGLEQMQTLQNALQQGKISEVNYYGRLATLSKQLRTRYPGYEAVVDATIQSVTGTRPANAYRDAIFSELGRASAEASSEEKFRRQYLKENEGILAAVYGDDFFQNPDSFEFEKVQADVAKFKGRAEIIDAENKQLTLMSKRGEFNDKRAQRAVDRDFTFITESVLSKSVGANLPSYEKRISEFIAKGGGSPQELDQFIGTISQAETELRTTLLQRGRQEYVAKGLMSNEDLNKSIEQAMYPLTAAKEAVLGGNFQLAAKYATLNKNISDRNMNDLLQDPTILAGQGLSEINSALGEEFFRTRTDDIANTALEITGRTMLGQQDIVKKVVEHGDNKVSRSVIDTNFAALTDPNIQSGQVSNIVDQFFGPKALDFMDPKNVKAEDLETIYTRFLDPRVTKAIFEKGSAEDQQKYTAWAVEKFKAIPAFSAAAGDINTILGSTKKFDENARVEFDPKTMRLSIVADEPGFFSGGSGILGGTTAADSVNYRLVGRAVNAFNKSLSVLAPIIDASGEDRQVVLGSILKDLSISVDGVNPEAQSNGDRQTFWSSVYDALMTPVGSLQSEETNAQTRENLSILPEQEEDGGELDFMFDIDNSSYPSDIPTTKSARADYIREGLIDRGLSPHIAEAFVMNFRDESGLDPGINERNPIVPGSRGGFGLAQWTGPRRRQYEAFAQRRGRPLDDMDTQLDFLVRELRTTESRAARNIFSSPTRQEAAVSIVRDFLRPAASHRRRRENKYTRS